MWKSQRNVLGAVCDPLHTVLLRVETALVLGCCRDSGSSESPCQSTAPATVAVYTYNHCHDGLHIQSLPDSLGSQRLSKK